MLRVTKYFRARAASRPPAVRQTSWGAASLSLLSVTPRLVLSCDASCDASVPCQLLSVRRWNRPSRVKSRSFGSGVVSEAHEDAGGGSSEKLRRTGCCVHSRHARPRKGAPTRSRPTTCYEIAARILSPNSSMSNGLAITSRPSALPTSRAPGLAETAGGWGESNSRRPP